MNLERLIHRERFWRIGIDSKGYPVDLQRCLLERHAAMHPLAFKKVNLQDVTPDWGRVALLAKLVATIKRSHIKAATKAANAAALKRWVIWADHKELAFTHTNWADGLAAYANARQTRRQNITFLINLALESLEPTPNQRQMLVQFIDPELNADDDWILSVENNDGAQRRPDFLRLVQPGDANIEIRHWQKQVRETRKATVYETPRSDFIRALLRECRGCKVAGTKGGSIVVMFTLLRQWLIWVDECELGIDEDQALERLIGYSHFLTGRYRSTSLKAKSVVSQLTLLAGIVARVLQLETYQVAGKLSTPPLKSSGLTSLPPTTEELRAFCGFLHGIIAGISSKLVKSELAAPVPIKAGSYTVQLPAQNKRYENGPVPCVIRNAFVGRLRIFCEMHRFMALTGCNLQVAQDLTVGDWKNRKGEIEKYKPRKRGNVTLTIPQRYEHLISHHIEFLEDALPVSVGDASPLFPAVILPSIAASGIAARFRTNRLQLKAVVLGTSAAAACNDWFAAQNVPRLTSRQLRNCKSQWLLRKYKGDTLATSRALGNAPQTTFQHYGGKGNRAVAEREWAKFWEVGSKLRSSLAPGLCEAPGNFKPVENKRPGDAVGGCDAVACFGCANYRGEGSIDYIHRVLTLRVVLQCRVRANSQIEPGIKAIDQIVANFCQEYGGLADEVAALQRQVSENKEWHPRFSATVRLQEIISRA